jgi:type IV secretory pathway VirJ component
MGTSNYLRWILYLIFVVMAYPALTTAQTAAAAEILKYDKFEKLLIYTSGSQPKGLVLLLAGENGWDPQMVNLAQEITKLDYFVAGIDSMAYLSRPSQAASPCDDLVADLTQLARFLEHRYHLPTHPPILLGYAAGAAMVYVVLAQAPVATFHGGISLNFCPHLSQLDHLCNVQTLNKAAAGDKRNALWPEKRLVTTWFVFQAEPTCDKNSAAQFVNQIDNAKLTSLSKEHENAVNVKNKWPQLMALLQWLDPTTPNQVQPDTNIIGVPLTEVPAVVGTSDKRMAVMLSGDGGWAELDREVAAALAKHGIPTVGWDSLSYFWRAKTPDQAGADLDRVVRLYTEKWNKDEVLLIGYSFGADVLPFMADRLSPAMRNQIKLITFLGLGNAASFEFHLTDWLGGTTKNALPVLPQVMKLAWAKRLCLYGAQETDSACPDLTKFGVVVVRMPGGHHFDGNYQGIAEHLLGQLEH